MAYQYRGTLVHVEPEPEPTTTAKCGTNAGYMRHAQLGTPKCQPCRRAHAVCENLRRNPTKTRVQCATYSGYMQHKRAGEDACDMCLKAYAQYMRDYREKRQAA